MKKFISIALVVVGIISAAWTVKTVYKFGSANMRRVDQAAYQWRLEHHGP